MVNLVKMLMLVSLIMLAGCQQHQEDLHAYVARIKAQKKSDIPPIPVMKPYKKFTYAASDLRDPFVPTVVEVPKAEPVKRADNGVHPDQHRRKEALEAYDLSSLQFVGTLQQNTLWALIRAPDGVIHRVQVGNYLGKNNGKILSISDNKVILKEIVPDPQGGYVFRDNSLSIANIK